MQNNPWDSDINSSESNRPNFSVNFNDFNITPGKIILFLAVVVIMWLLSGFYLVKEGEQALVMRFGKIVRVDNAGLNYRLPTPIETVDIENVNRSRITEIGYKAHASRDRAGILHEGIMLTGDENIVSLNCTVMWHINDVSKFLLKVKNRDLTIKLVAESAIREIVGQSEIVSILSNQKQKIAEDVRKLAQDILDKYNIGVTIEHVQLLKAEPPEEVIDAYRDVQTARADRESVINEAQAYANKILPRSRGEAEKLIQQAQAYKYNVVKEAEAHVERYRALYDAYLINNGVTKNRMYFDMIDSVLKDKSILVTEGVLPHLQVNK